MTESGDIYGIARAEQIAHAEHPYRLMARNAREANLEAEAEVLDHMANHAGRQAERIFEDPDAVAQPFIESDMGRTIAEKQKYLLYLVDAASGINTALTESNEEFIPITSRNIQIVGDRLAREDDSLVDRRINVVYSILGANRDSQLFTESHIRVHQFAEYQTMTNMGLILREEIVDRDADPDYVSPGGTVFLSVKKVNLLKKCLLAKLIYCNLAKMERLLSLRSRIASIMSRVSKFLSNASFLFQ